MTFTEEELSVGPSMVAMLQLENAELRLKLEELTAAALKDGVEAAAPDGTRRVCGGFYVRDKAPHPPVLRRSKIVDWPSPLIGSQCYGCGAPFEPLSSIVLVTVGPGGDEHIQEKWRNGQWCSAVAIPLHARCAGEP